MKKIRISPYIVIMICFLAPILIGAGLLCLPFAHQPGKTLSFVDALFLSTSSICVTGLSVVDVGTTLSIFGQAVMAVLIEIGGVSILTIACFFILFVQKKLAYSTQTIMQEMLNRDTMADIKSLIRKIIVFSLVVQFIGAVVNCIVFLLHYDDAGFAVRAAVFHTVSAYNNAGFDVLGTGDNLVTITRELSPVLNAIFKINTMLLIVIGGIGVIFLDDLWKKKSWKKLTVSSKVVFIVTGGIIFGGGLLLKLFYFLDGQNVSLLECFFLVVSSRTAGFDNVGLYENTPGTVQSLLVFTMYVGASPASTGGGVKTTTFFVVVAVIFAFIRGKRPAFSYKSISQQTILKAFVLIIFSILYILVAVIAISGVEGENAVVSDIVFEVVSAFSTTGLSLGITPHLAAASKLILCLTMYVGRVGILTFLSAMNKSWIFSKSEDDVKYVEENIVVG